MVIASRILLLFFVSLPLSGTRILKILIAQCHFALLHIDLLNHGYTHISARPVDTISSAKAVIMQPEDVCLLTDG